MSAIIHIHKLSKSFNHLLAVDNVSLDIEEGECFGLLGPNGAGKTSLIRMIIAASPATSGDISVMDKDLRNHAREIKASLGVIPQVDNLDPDLNVIQNLLTFARYYGIPKEEARRRSIEVLTLFELQNRTSSKINQLSSGMRRRLLIARGLINQPKILILDEPSIGLDPQAKHLVWQKLSELRAQKVTLLMCTQNMEEAEVLCDRVAVMHQGRLLTLGTPRTLIKQLVGDVVVEMEVDSGTRPAVIQALQLRGLQFDEVGHQIYVFASENIDATRDIINLTPKVRRRPATLEDVFFRLTGRTLYE